MRNDISSFATADSNSEAMDVSFVHVPNSTESNEPALAVKTISKHDIIGASSGMTTTQVCVNMIARDLPDDDSQRAPADIIVALDVSGSMQGSKLRLCKETLLLLLRVLYPKDRFGLVCYGSEAVLSIPVQTMSEANKKVCREKIQGLKTRGCTNISAAIGLAYQEMKQIERPNAVQAVFLLTDGHANFGISDQEDLLEFTSRLNTQGAGEQPTVHSIEGVEEQPTRKFWPAFPRRNNGNSRGGESVPSSINLDPEKMEAFNPISLHCFGFGSDHNSTLLQKMSNAGPNGSYYFVESDVDVGSAFGDCLGGVLSVVAQNVVLTLSIEVEAKEKGVEIVDVHHENKVKRENGAYTVVVGDFYAEESRDILFVVKLATGDDLGNKPIAHAKTSVSYTDTLRKMPVVAPPAVCSIARPIGSEVSDASPHVKVQWTRVVATKAMAEANQLAQASDFASAKNCLLYAKREVRGAAKGLEAHFQTTLASLDADMEELECELQSESTYNTTGWHKFSNSIASNTKQRCMKSAAAAIDANAYASRRKKTMAKTLAFKK